MKKLLVALLLLNVVFFGYTRLIGAPPARIVADAGPAIPRLELASERKNVPGRRCQSVGPFNDAAAARETGQWLAKAHHAIRERRLEADGPVSFRLLLTAPSLQQALRTAARLKAEGVTDVEVVPPEPGRTQAFVALGLYSDGAHVQARIASLKRNGVVPAVVEQQRRVSQWWLDVELSGAEPPLDLAVLTASVPNAAETTLGSCAAANPSPETPAPGLPAPPAAPPKEKSPQPVAAKPPNAPA